MKAGEHLEDVLFVATNGRDSNPWAESAPLLTFAGAAAEGTWRPTGKGTRGRLTPGSPAVITLAGMISW